MTETIEKAGLTRDDLMSLTKARLSMLVVVTTFVGFLLASKNGIDWRTLIHTLIGTSFAAFGSSVFNQLMEIDADAKMERTASRPLPAKRIKPPVAFILGWGLAAFGVVHLLVMVNQPASIWAAITLAVYIFVYTPLKRRSTLNTIVGAIAGGIPPVIGWVAAGGAHDFGALFLFGLLFWWQLPHFIAINWMYRQQYIDGGFVMWSNDDESGRKTATLAIVFSICTAVWLALPYFFGAANLIFLIGGLVLSLAMLHLSIQFYKQRERTAARKLFFYTLIYLPLVLGLSVFTWNKL